MSGCEGAWAGYSYCTYTAPQVQHTYNQPTQYCNPHILQSFHHSHYSSPYTDFPDGTPSCPPHYWDGDELIDAFGRVVKRRSSANKKERRRTQSINNAFSELRDCIPNVPADTKLSKIKTLRLATSYIAYLMQLLHTDPEIAVYSQFKAELPPKPRRTSSDIEREDSDMETDSSGSPTSETLQSISILAAPTTDHSACPSTTLPAVVCATTTMAPKQAWPQTVWQKELQY